MIAKVFNFNRPKWRISWLCGLFTNQPNLLPRLIRCHLTRVGIYASVSATAATALGAGLLVEAVAGPTATKTLILSVLTQPAWSYTMQFTLLKKLSLLEHLLVPYQAQLN